MESVSITLDVVRADAGRHGQYWRATSPQVEGVTLLSGSLDSIYETAPVEFRELIKRHTGRDAEVKLESIKISYST